MIDDESPGCGCMFCRITSNGMLQNLCALGSEPEASRLSTGGVVIHIRPMVINRIVGSSVFGCRQWIHHGGGIPMG